jgi:hypothetical protein
LASLQRQSLRNFRFGIETTNGSIGVVDAPSIRIERRLNFKVNASAVGIDMSLPSGKRSLRRLRINLSKSVGSN